MGEKKRVNVNDTITLIIITCGSISVYVLTWKSKQAVVFLI
jgi:hypothetical protein